MSDKIRILAVDDEIFNLKLLSTCLGKEKYHIAGCTNAVDALRTFKAEFFDVILLDVIMPGIDGFELRKLFREISQEKPIIFLTAMVDDVNATLLNQVSWDPYTYYLKKSFHKKTLMEKIDQVVNIYRSRKQMLTYCNQLESELALAGEVQKILLPPWCTLSEHAVLSAIYRPKSQVSGDIYDFFHIEGSKYLLFVGDIAGHGISSALYMTAVQSFVKVAAIEKKSEPHNILNTLNAFFCGELGTESYMTCLVAVIDFEKNTISMQSAGHPALLSCSRDGTVSELGGNDKGGLPIGWFADRMYLEENTGEYTFRDDDIIIGYTDGLLDMADNDGESFDIEKLKELLTPLAGSSDAVILPSQLHSLMEQFGFENAPDDICILALQKRDLNPDKIEMLVAAKLPEVSKSAVKISEKVKALTGLPEPCTKLELLIHEYLNNVIIHGLKKKQNGRNGIFLSLEKKDRELLLRGVDLGKTWGGEKTAHSTQNIERPEDDPASPAMSGRGLKIIQDITSKVVRNQYSGINETIFTVEF